MSEVGYAATPDVAIDNPVKSLSDYQSLKASLDAAPGHPKANRGRHLLALFRTNNPQAFDAVSSGLAATQPKLDSMLSDDVKTGGPQQVKRDAVHERVVKQVAPDALGGTLDLSVEQGPYIRSLQDDAKREAELDKLTRLPDDSPIKNASRLKVFTAPADYRPPRALSTMQGIGDAVKGTQAWVEPNIEEFQEALKHGKLATQLKKEFGQENNRDFAPEQLIPGEIEKSRTFQAFKDGLWQQAYANAIKTRTPISRLAYSTMLGPVERFEAENLDPSVSTTSGMAQGMTMGLYDPATRAISPEFAEGERRSRLRNPKSALFGEVVGALSPGGLTSRALSGATGLLERAGAKMGAKIAAKPLTRLGVSMGSAAGVGAAEANIRAAAQAASDALDASDSAKEAAKRIWDAVSAKNAVHGAMYGAGAGAVGHGLGSIAQGVNRQIVGNRIDALQPAANEGISMGAFGGPKLPPEAEAARVAGLKAGKSADDLLAREAMEPMLQTRRLEQEGAARRAESETATARDNIRTNPTVPTTPIADNVMAIVDDMPAATPQGASKQTALRRWARKVRDKGQLTPKELDSLAEEADAQANFDGKSTDPHWAQVAKVIKDARDELKFDDPTSVDNFAVRDKLGNTKAVTDYSGLKARQSREQGQQHFDNQQMGLPKDLAVKPTEIGRVSASDEATGQFLAAHDNYDPLMRFINEDRAISSRLERGQTPAEVRPGRTQSALQSQYGAAKALRDAADSGHVYGGTVYRGAALTPEQLQQTIGKGEVTNDSIWSAGKEREYAMEFASKAGKAGRQPVLFEIEGGAGVPLDGIPGSNTFNEVAIPTGEPMKVVDSFRDPNGVLVVKLKASKASLDDLAGASKPTVKLNANEDKTFYNKVRSVVEPTESLSAEGVSRDKIVALADRAGVGKNIKLMKQLRAGQNWNTLIGDAFRDVGKSPLRMAEGIREKYALRAVPTLKSISGGMTHPGGLPKMEANDKLVDLVDRFIDQSVPEGVLGGKGFNVPGTGKRMEFRSALNLRGGQGARPVGAALAAGSEKGKRREEMSDEEAQLAATILKNIIAMEGKKQ